MIDSLLTKVAGVLERDFLFGSFIPVFLFIGAIGWTLAGVFGLEGSLGLWDNMGATQKVLTSLFFGLGMVVLAYTMHGLRGANARVWSGESPLNYLLWSITKGLEQYYLNQYQRKKADANRYLDWSKTKQDFQQQVRLRYDVTRGNIDPHERNNLERTLRSLDKLQTPADFGRGLQTIIVAYQRFSGESLTFAYRNVLELLSLKHSSFLMDSQADAFYLDRHFGTPSTIRATSLGNIVASYNLYPYKRYSIEGEILWPRLLAVIPAEYKSELEDPRILMDFALTTATLALIYAYLALAVGPWLWFNPILWLVAAIVGLLIVIAAYLLTLRAALELGERTRAAFDLYHLKLLEALNRPAPANLEEARAIWKQQSQLVVYGDVAGEFKYTGASAAPAPPEPTQVQVQGKVDLKVGL